MKIPLSRPLVGRSELNAVREVFQSGWLGMGKQVFEFEDYLRKLFKRKYVIAVSTGTNAIHIALDAIGIKKGDEVIVPSMTFAGSIQPIVMCGAKPVFCDVEKNTLNTSLELIEKKITRKTKAVIVVHNGGLPCNMDRILGLKKKYKIRVIEDAAHAFGSRYKGRLIGSFGDITCFSFDPIKTITCGEGGAVVLDNKNIADLIIKKRILGINRDTWRRYKHKRSWFYSVKTMGFRYHMSNINAAIGIEQLKKIESLIKTRQDAALFYEKRLSDLKDVTLVKRDYNKIVPFNFTILAEKRDRLMSYLKGSGITTGINYIPNHIQPYFKSGKTSLPNTEYLYEKIISLPIYSGIKKKEITFVVNRIKDFYKKR